MSRAPSGASGGGGGGRGGSGRPAPHISQTVPLFQNVHELHVHPLHPPPPSDEASDGDGASEVRLNLVRVDVDEDGGGGSEPAPAQTRDAASPSARDDGPAASVAARAPALTAKLFLFLLFYGLRP